jgi:agmatine/peptidylarginine deiminase
VTNASEVLQNVSFFPAHVDSEWIRDYAPIFALGSNGEEILLDAMYRDVWAEEQTARSIAGQPTFLSTIGSTYLSDVGTFWRRNDDAAPIYFNEYLYTIDSKHRLMVRPPVQLWGGDAIFEIPGTLITSTESLNLNGGNPNAFGTILSNYYGVTNVIYLRALPNTIGHVDMFFKIGEGCVGLLAEFVDSTPFQSDLLKRSHSTARDRMEWNDGLLKRALPRLKVVRLPMPPVNFSSLNPDGEGIRAVVSYRSYLNSVAIMRGGKAIAVLIPDYPEVAGMREAVLGAYRKAFPVAEFHFIDSSGINDEFGGIHCTTATIHTR